MNELYAVKNEVKKSHQNLIDSLFGFSFVCAYNFCEQVRKLLKLKV